jgi:hypothetical protein
MPFGLGADDGDLDIKLAQGTVDVANVRNFLRVGELLVAFVCPFGNLRVICHDN